jgi:hypothetical protein
MAEICVVHETRERVNGRQCTSLVSSIIADTDIIVIIVITINVKNHLLRPCQAGSNQLLSSKQLLSLHRRQKHRISEHRRKLASQQVAAAAPHSQQFRPDLLVRCCRGSAGDCGCVAQRLVVKAANALICCDLGAMCNQNKIVPSKLKSPTD